MAGSLKMDKPQVSFRPFKPTSQDDFTIVVNGQDVGTLYWKRGPKPDDKTAIVRDLNENIFICSGEHQAILWILKGMDKK